MTQSWNLPWAEKADESLKAELALADMELHEDLALLYQEETCPRLRAQFARRYEELIGVHPDARGALGVALKRVADDGAAVQ